MNHPYDMSSSNYSERSATDIQEIQMPICERTLNTDVAGDFTLPDYQPEIKRLLRINTSLTPPERYVSGDELILEGTLDYFVLYMGNDNGLYCAPLSTDYRMTLSLSEEREKEKDHRRPSGAPSPLDGTPLCACDITAETSGGRVTAPRRLNIKSRLKANVKALGSCAISAEGASDTPSTAEQLMGTVQTSEFLQIIGEPLSLQDDMILSPAEGAELRVICAEGVVMVQEAIAAQGLVTCHGEVMLKLTLCPAEDEEGTTATPVISTRKLPFSQAIPLEGLTPECTCCAHGVCHEMSVEVEEGHLHADLGILLEVLALKDVSSSYTKDLYSTRKETVASYGNYPLRRGVGCFNGNFTLSDSLSLSDTGIHPAARVIDVTATAYPEALTADPAKSKCTLTGHCRVQLLLFRDGEYSSTTLELPFRYEKEGLSRLSQEDIRDLSFDGCVHAMNCRARMDGERIGIDAELAVALRITAGKSVTALTSVKYGDEVTRHQGEYVICFPSAEDSLWSVAKRYHAPLAALGAANGLALDKEPDDQGSLQGIKYLIV